MGAQPDKKSTLQICGLACLFIGSFISIDAHCTASEAHTAPASRSYLPRIWPNTDLQNLLRGYNYILKTSAAGKVESLIVSGENGSGLGNRIADASLVSKTPVALPFGDGSDQPSTKFSESLQGQDAIDALGAQLPAIASEHGMSTDRLREILLNDTTAWLDTSGRLYYVEAPPAAEPGEQTEGSGNNVIAPPVAALVELGKTFQLHSKSGASKIIYLDFNGQTVTGTGWNNSYSLPTISAPAFDTGGNASVFDDAELTRIQNIWSRVAEDYAPFDIDVTTEEPSADALDRSSSSDQAYGTRAIITKRLLPCSCGGIAYVGIFDYTTSYYKPAWIFYDMLGGGDEKFVAEAISHEVGHNLGLNHDGGTGTGYYQGHGAGATGWAPIMGVGYYRELVQWSQGEYPGANNHEDDINILQSHGAAIRADDAGDAPGSAVALAGSLSGGTLVASQAGVIERRGDLDYYVFTSAGGQVNFDVAPAALGPNLDVSLALFSAEGSLVAAANPTDTLDASLSANLTPGTFYLRVSGAGKAANGTDYGYTDYGSLGQYQISGRLAQGATQAPAALATASASNGIAPLEVQFSGTDSSDDGTITRYSWDFGDGSSSTEPNPTHTFTFAGTFAVKLTVTDDAGLTSEASVSVSVAAQGAPTASRVLEMMIELSQKLKKARAKVQLQVTNGLGQPIPGTLVKGKWRGLVKGKVKGITDDSGIVTLSSPATKKKGTFTFSVSGLSGHGYTYDPSLNSQTIISLTR
ncbi:PKD domain-containing protein [Methyloterricola oryzae]|uniref:PKD domain-containing protein n=1 Tax=Methyloterricola oryzae TaxID=1495050 RepID=UPI00069C8D8F|nr:PKD domain-containing protein [Methyloterricola oryzae]